MLLFTSVSIQFPENLPTWSLYLGVWELEGRLIKQIQVLTKVDKVLFIYGLAHYCPSIIQVVCVTTSRPGPLLFIILTVCSNKLIHCIPLMSFDFI